MLVYTALKKDFVQDVFQNRIADKVLESYVRETESGTTQNEVRSWENSLRYMKDIVDTSSIPDTAGIAIEYRLPQTSKRIDFIISGMDQSERKTAVIVELKQWEDSEKTDLDGIVRTFVGKGKREVSHPSYQVWSYAAFLEDFNCSVQDENIAIKPCAYLHNYKKGNGILSSFYAVYIHKAPLFLKYDAQKLRDFIKKYISYGDNKQTLYLIENGKIKPSKQLADSVASMLYGNKEFVMIDDQKIVYEKALKLAKESSEAKKNVFIVSGGPGTGKSVVAINLLAELTRCSLNTKYVTQNSAPRKVYEIKLTGKFTKTRITNLFGSAGSFHDAEANTFDALIVDEAHRLNSKSGMFSHLGENQVKEIINASKFSIFFIDEDQQVTFKDIGHVKEIEKWAKLYGASVSYEELASQFRCSGSDGYIAWLDHVLQLHETANSKLDTEEYDFKVFDDPAQLHEEIRKKNGNNKSRVVAGYCWKWVSKKDPRAYDIIIGDYKARWNLEKHGQAWIVHKESVSEVGCIHTCQGLELDYVGVIIGPDLIVRDGKIVTDVTKRDGGDKTVHGYKKMLKEDKEATLELADRIIKNTYRTLMTRGIKGCYVFSEDKETSEYFKERVNNKKYPILEEKLYIP
ncbi:MAG: DUF2075 domain-containing protein [Patescibacteria group bacterium]|nr:DUF2075 domain-containing protein [Patescibacteria group bacterium]